MKNKSSKFTNTFLFPEMSESRLRDNSLFAYLLNSKELNKYFELLISLYPITDGRMLLITRNLRDNIDILWRNNGAEYTVTYLKEANRIFQFFVAGNPQKSSLPTMIGAPSGLPSILPPGHRDLLINKTSHRDFANVVRIIFALLGCYRLIVYKGKLKLETITEPSDSMGVNPWELGLCLSTKFKGLFERMTLKDYDYKLLSLSTAGPNNKVSILSASLDAIALRNSDILDHLHYLSSYFKIGVYSLLEQELKVLETIKGRGTELLGKLSIKEEPAGKRRVFAIVDIWTQSVLKPMHDQVFSILKLIEQDGAFDQIKPVKALIKSNTEGKTFCFDLSAATDRFPISVQVDVLSFLYNRNVAESWKQLLVNRSYYLSETKQSYRYATGQPMGALSSWGVFSLCHHVIVQIAATRVGIRSWFTQYALLGDDIVITNEEVANEYFKIMTEELKVSINKSKSLQSSIGVMEFAKRIIGPQGDYSPVGPKNLAILLRNKLHLPSLLVDLREKGVGIDYFLVKKLLSNFKRKGLFKFTWTELHAFIWSLTKPFGFLDSHSMMPQKWVHHLGKGEVISNNAKLLEFLKEEWFLQRDEAIASVKLALDKYSGWINVNGVFMNSDTLPSIQEQKRKLFDEYLRLTCLGIPDMELKVNGMYVPQDIDLDLDPWEALNPVQPGSVSVHTYRDNPNFMSHVTLSLILRDPDTQHIVVEKKFDFSKPEYALSQVLGYLLEYLPPVTPVTSPVSVSDIRIINRSLRHVSYQFLKKFINWQPSQN